MPLRSVVASVATLAALTVPAAATAATPAPAPPKHLSTRVVVKQFVVRRTGLSALGTATTNVGGNATRQVVALKAQTGLGCQVLTLRLDRLNLSLLGLRLDVSAVNLRITGNRARTLGALFCKLATATNLGNLTKARAAAASLNHRLRVAPLRMVGFDAMLYPKTVPADSPSGAPAPAPGDAAPRQATGTTTAPVPAGPTCPVLDLTLGPLNLDLLGLVVDLYGATNRDPVRVTAVADPAAGILGKALCQISTQAPA